MKNNSEAVVDHFPNCELWPGQLHKASGYGVQRVDGKRVRAHRWVWEQANGPIPEGMEVMHLCDNPPCVRLDHLKLGTHAENLGDMAAKGRARPGPGKPFAAGDGRKRGPRKGHGGHPQGRDPKTGRWVK